MLAMQAEGQTGDAAPGPKAPRRFGPARWLLRLPPLVAVLLSGWWLAEVLVGDNVHTVIPGRVYRGAQPSADLLERLVRDHGIRTVVNLRGCCTPLPWYLEEGEAAQRLGLSVEDVSFSALHLPAPGELRLLLDVLDRSDYPIYLHCRHGSDRTGMAAAMVLLLTDGVPYAEARRQLALYYGHLSVGKTAQLDRFFDLYQQWLAARGQEHAPALFRHWVLDEYRGGWCDGRVEMVQPLGPARAWQPIAYRVRVRNQSRALWRLHPTACAGIHVCYRLLDERGNGAGEGRAALFEAEVPPGAPLEVTMVIDPLAAGRYFLTVDLVEECHCWFSQAGAEPWEEELLVRE